MAKISVLMPVYNGEKYLKESLESILLQTFSDFEFIIINDGSTDKSKDIIEEYKNRDNRIILINNPSNLGITKSLNIGLKHCTGKYIARMDADDISLPQRLQIQYDYMEKHPSVGVVGSQMSIIKEGKEIKEINDYIVPTEHNAIVLNLLIGKAIAHPTAFIRLSILKNKQYNEKLNSSQDLELWLSLISNNTFANLNEKLVQYRDHTDNISNKYREEQQKNKLDIKQQFITDILNIKIDKNDILLLEKSQNSLNTFEKKDIKRVISLIIKIFNKLKEKNILNSETNSYQTLSELILNANRCLKLHNEDIPKANLARTYWKSVLPENLWPLARKIMHNKAINKTFLDDKKTKNKIEIKKTNNSKSPQQKGLSLIILSYNRLNGLQELLKSLEEQNLNDLKLEIIIINNYEKNVLKNNLSKLVNNFDDIKIIDSSHNYKCQIRYNMATLAKYNTILFIDDDIVLQDKNFLTYMLSNFEKLTDKDILSCWNYLWLDISEKGFSEILINFKSKIEKIIKTDSCGPGITMFSKKILMNKKILDMTPEFKDADDMGFPIIANLEYGSQIYHLPSYGMLQFHKEYSKESLSKKETRDKAMHQLYKTFIKDGYTPLNKREDINSYGIDFKTIPSIKHEW